MPQSKIDSKCFNLTKKVDVFLSLSNYGRTNLAPPDFWKELARDEEAVSRSVLGAMLATVVCSAGWRAGHEAMQQVQRRDAARLGLH